MAWEDMLDHKCDIFHVQNDTNSLGYGVSDTEHYSYPNKADIEDVDCHFHVKTGRYVISQTKRLQRKSKAQPSVWNGHKEK